MKKSITVRKCKKHRYTICFFTMLAAVFSVVIVMLTQQVLFAFVGCVPLLCFIPMMLYYETWKIKFGVAEIEKSVFLGKKMRYSYVQLQKVVKGRYTSERCVVIRMIFCDEKVMQFCQNDENAEKAEKLLLKHCSIKNSY